MNNLKEWKLEYLQWHHTLVGERVETTRYWKRFPSTLKTLESAIQSWEIKKKTNFYNPADVRLVNLATGEIISCAALL